MSMEPKDSQNVLDVYPCVDTNGALTTIDAPMGFANTAEMYAHIQELRSKGPVDPTTCPHDFTRYEPKRAQRAVCHVCDAKLGKDRKGDFFVLPPGAA